MKSILIIAVLIIHSFFCFSQNEIRINDLNVGNGILDIEEIDSSYIINVFTYSPDGTLPSKIFKISKTGVIIKSINLEAEFPGNSCIEVVKMKKIEQDNYVALCNVQYSSIQKLESKLIFFNENLDILTMKVVSDTSKLKKMYSFIIDSQNQMVIIGNEYENNFTTSKVYLGKFSSLGDLIVENSFTDSNCYKPNNIVELPYYSKYIVEFYSNNYLVIDTNLQNSKYLFMAWFGGAICGQTYSISDRKFATGISISPASSPTQMRDVGIFVKDTTMLNPEINPGQVPEIYTFGELNHNDQLIGWDYVAPDTAYLSYYFDDALISPKNVFTLQKITTTGVSIWSKNYTSNVNRLLRVKATNSGLILNGLYFDGAMIIDPDSTHPIIIPLDKNGNTTGIENAGLLSTPIIIFPNPARSKVSIRCDYEKNQQIEIYNVVGQKVFQKKLLNNSFENTITIDVSSFAKGTYIVKLTGEKNTNTEKFLVE